MTLAGIGLAQIRHWSSRSLWTVIAFAVVSAATAAIPLTTYLSGATAQNRAIESLSPRDSTVVVQATSLQGEAQLRAFQRDVSDRSRSQAAGLVTPIGFEVASRFFDISSLNGHAIPPNQRNSVLQFVSHDGIQAHAELVAGRWPQVGSGAIETSLSQSAAAAISAKVGDRLCVSEGTGADAICTTVVGVWRPVDPASALWVGESGLAVEAEVSHEDLLGRISQLAPNLQATATLAPHKSAIESADPDLVADRLSMIAYQLGGNVPGRQVVTSLGDDVGAFVEHQRTAARAMTVLGVELWLITAFVALFVVALALDQQSSAVALWRSMGWPKRLIVGLLMGELGALVVLGAVVGVPLGLVAAFALVAGTDRGVMPYLGYGVRNAVPLCAGLLALLLIAIGMLVYLSARVPIVRVRTEKSRPTAGWWTSPWFTVGALLLSVPLLIEGASLAQARIAADHAGTPWDVFMPGVGLGLLIAGAVQLLPFAGRVASRLRLPIYARLAAVQIGRGGHWQQLLAAAFGSAIAVAILCGGYSGTAVRSASDRAAYAAGADVRASAIGGQPVDLTAATPRGATASSQVYRGYATPGFLKESIQVMGVDPSSFGKVASTRADLMPSGFDSGLRKLASAETGGTVLPDGATEMSIEVRGAHTGGRLSAVLTDSTGRTLIADFGSLDFDGWRALTAAVPAAVGTVRLRHLTFSPVTTPGTVAVSRLQALGSAQGPQLLALFSAPEHGLPDARTLWWMSDGTTGSYLQPLQPDNQYALDGRSTAHLFLAPGWLPVTIHPPLLELTVRPGNDFTLLEPPVPALVSTGLLTRLHAKVDDTIFVSVDGKPVPAIIAGVFEGFPTLYGDAAVFALAPLLEALGGQGAANAWPSELWLKTPANQQGAIAAALSSNPQIGDVVSVDGLRQQQLSDPMVAAGRSNLLLTFGCAALLALVALGTYLAVIRGSRIAEYAILRANGLPDKEIGLSLGLEAAAILVAAALVGLAAGAVLVVTLVPALRVTTSIEDLSPPEILTFDPLLTLVALPSFALLAVALAWAVIVRRRAGSAAEQLRQLG